MKYLFETVIFCAMVAAPASIMLAAAWLIYKQAEGWRWYLLAALLIAGSMRIRFDGFGVS